MGFFDWFRSKPKGREYWVRADYRDLPPTEWTDDEYDHYMAHCTDEEYWAEWERWSRETGPHPGGIKYLKRAALDLARQAAQDTDSSQDPREFACMLAVEGDTVTELVLLPGTVAGDEHAIFEFYMQPVDRSVRGTLHSHPDEHPYPSDADFELFDKHGDVHIILCRPYGPDDWRAYDFAGRPVHLDVVD